MDAATETENPVRILIVDDHPNTATMLARVLSKFDKPVEVLTASSGEDAISKIGDRMTDILITDFMMPGLNGLELIEKLKGEQKPFYTILITAYDTPGLAITARRLNVQDYLVKPVQPEKIRSIVSRVIDEIRPSEQAPSNNIKRTFKILIADDYPDNLRLLSTRLKSEGYTFVPAWDGEETLRKTRQENPDLVLLDVNMPKKDGFQVLAEMRADPAISHIPVIVITAARIGPKDVREGLTLGADDYVIKPFDWRELAARIRSKLRVKEAEDVLRKRTKELGILPEIGQELSAGLDIEKLTHTIVNRTVEVLGATNARLDLFQSDGSVLCRTRQIHDEASYIIDEPYELVTQRGLIPEVLASKQGVVVNNLEQDARWHGAKHNGEASAVAVPLMGRRDVIGVLTLTHNQVSYFNEDHQTLLLAIASQAAIAIENAQLLDVEHKRVQELMILNQINQEINRFTHSRQLLDSLPRLIQEGLGYPSVAIWNGGPIEGQNVINDLKLCSMAGVSQDLDSDLMVAAPQQAAREQKTVRLSDPEGHFSITAVPMMLEGKVQGVLVVSNSQSKGTHEGDQALLETLSTQIAAAMERVGLFESVEQEQRRLLAVLHSAADAILVMDAQMRLTLANPAGERLFSDLDSRVGRAFPEDEGYEGLNELLWKVCKNGVHQQGEVNWPDGRVFSVVVTPIEEGGQVAVLHDVSHFKALAELKNEYIATATHDLKNPIQAVLGYNDLLKKAGELNPMQQDFSKRIRSSALQMRDLVLNLLEISRLESGMKMNLETLDLKEVLEDTATELQDQVQAKRHNLELKLCNGQIPIQGDRILLQQLVRNLLGNAIKYTTENGQITLTAMIEDDHVLVKFQDTGVGIPSEDLPHIFEKFFRVRTDETRDIEGTGLGLAIVISIVENHNGTIEVHSVVGKGSSFDVRLPLHLPA